MARRKQTKGLCAYCGKELSKSGMSKHLASCKDRQAAIAKAEQSKAKPENLYHLRVQDAYGGDYWLNLEMRGSKTLNDLDNYLRVIWLECCGHLSEFSLGRFADTIGKRRQIDDVFSRIDTLNHTYDFGTSSETVVKRVDVRQGKPLTKQPIVLMARNNPPEMLCMECGKPATHLCIECQIEEGLEGTLCDAHTASHPHDNYGEPMPIVNSPRIGMCGYCGPADPPY
jgi:hypothetical protein